ncbi:MAG TPA: type II toxin-antitoxin system HicB family antitoxin [bacterium]|jgi:predicted RNase H-like HicB family nuclease
MKIELRVDYFEEDDVIVALCPDLQVSSYGNSLEEAENSIKEALELFFEGCESLGTLQEVLEEAGFKKQGNKWTHRQPIKTSHTLLERASTTSYA